MKHSRLFTPQIFSNAQESRVIKNNMTIDYYLGNSKIVEEFSMRNLQFVRHYKMIQSLPVIQQRKLIENAKVKSLLITGIMLTGECNANCGICYTDRKHKDNELSFSEIKCVIDQTYRLGSRVLYIPGEGEPMLDKSFWNVLEYARGIGMKVIIFTNGILLSNTVAARERWGISSEDIAKKLVKYPVYIYHKLWSTNPDLIEKMMAISPSTYEYVRLNVGHRKMWIPKGIVLLLKWLPPEKIGIQTVIEKRNVRVILETIIPFIEKTKIRSFMELLLHSGRSFGHFNYDVNINQYLELSKHIARRHCRRVAYQITVHNNGFLSPGIALFPWECKSILNKDELNIRSYSGKVKDLFIMIHTHPLLVKSRYNISGCICEETNIEMTRDTTSREKLKTQILCHV